MHDTILRNQDKSSVEIAEVSNVPQIYNVLSLQNDGFLQGKP